MPNCFVLYPKDYPGKPAVLQGVDQLMCEHFGTEPDPEHWYRNWYGLIGLGLALGNSWAKLRTIFPNHIDIIDWLEANYTTEAWYERK